MARVRVPISDNDLNNALSQKAAKILGEQPQPVAAPEQTPQITVSKALATRIAVAAVVVIILVVSLVIVMSKDDKKPTEVQKQDETQQIVGVIDQFMILPTDETPTLLNVSEVEKLQSQSFFKSAQNGDRILLYAKAGKAILYRPSVKKIVEVASTATPTTPKQ